MDVRRTLYIAEHYAHLQGLRLVPLGVCFLLSAAWRAGLLSWLPGSVGRGAQLWFLTSFLIAVVASWPIGSWYRHRMGAAAARAGHSGAVTLTMSVVAFVTLASLPPNGWHVSLAMVFVAAVFAY